MKLKIFIFKSSFVFLALILFIILMLNVSYIPVRDGYLYLKRANSTVFLYREHKYGIHHIKADTIEMAVYA
jgi:hypothetical protein